MIQYLLHHQIDKGEWDRLNERSPYSSFYNASGVLDITSPGWQALIDRETGHVMPLTCRKKFGFHYLYQPIGIQYLGVHGPDANNNLARFLQAIPSHFLLWDICVGQQTPVMDIQSTASSNCVLNLNRPYAEISAGFSTNHKRNLKTAPPVMESVGIEQFMHWYAVTSAKRFHISRSDQKVIEHLLRYTEKEGCLKILGVAGTKCAVALIRWKDTLIFFKSTNDEKGKEVRGLFHLIDHTIKDHVNQQVLLDFAGSDNLNTQRFYKGFGVETRVYLRLKHNALPFPFRFLKS